MKNDENKCDAHSYLFSSERGRKRAPRSEEIDEVLDGARYGKWTIRIIPYVVTAVTGTMAFLKGWF